ncbi:MAG: DUF2784 domain-containing protein [Chitinophagaceae bacterium]
MWLPYLNVFFFVFHTGLTLFNLTGWIFPATRKWHRFTILLTAFSWFVLGIWFGWGYCACTDWHWQVREAMGIHDRSNSYIHFLLLKLTGRDFDPGLVEQVTLYTFIFCVVAAVWVFIRDRHRKRKERIES